MRRNSLLFFFFLFLLCHVSAFNVSSYDYKMTLDAVCSEYEGYVKFEFPGEFSEIESPSVYSEDELFVDDEIGGRFWDKNRDWFVNFLAGYDVREIEAVFDGDYDSDLVLRESGVGLVFQNPLSVKVDKIIIDTTQSGYYFTVYADDNCYVCRLCKNLQRDRHAEVILFDFLLTRLSAKDYLLSFSIYQWRLRTLSSLSVSVCWMYIE